MNTQLQKFFEKYNLREKDKFEINQIFGLLPPDKQNNILENFDTLAFRLEQQHKEIELERRILVGGFYKKVENFYENFGDKL